MIINHTKDKGDLGLISVVKDLELKGVKSCIPISEHLPFDLIAVRNDGKLARVSVKYRSLKDGAIEVPLRSCYANSGGSYAKTIDFGLIDCIAVYCPETDKCYYVPVSVLTGIRNTFVLRTKDSLQREGRSNIADDYLSVDSIWK